MAHTDNLCVIYKYQRHSIKDRLRMFPSKKTMTGNDSQRSELMTGHVHNLKEISTKIITFVAPRRNWIEGEKY